MHVQRGDLVQIIAGAEKGKTGKVTTVYCSLLLDCKAIFPKLEAIVTKVSAFSGHYKDRADSG